MFREIEHGSPEWYEAVRLRENILRKPLGQTFSSEELNEEKRHYQIVGYLNKKLIATAVLVPERGSLKMQRVVVRESQRNFNIGSQMVAFCEKLAIERNYSIIYCHARDSAVRFYLKNDYQSEGDYFDEDGIPHLKMSKKLTSQN